MDAVRDAEVRAIGFAVRLILVACAVALVLSLAGIYAVMSLAVARRTREIGIRVALGASPRGIVSGVFRRPLTQVGLGIVAGAGLVLWLMGGMNRLLPFEDLAFLGVHVLFMTGVCVLACIVPTRRALAVEPTEALRGRCMMHCRLRSPEGVSTVCRKCLTCAEERGASRNVRRNRRRRVPAHMDGAARRQRHSLNRESAPPETCSSSTSATISSSACDAMVEVVANSAIVATSIAHAALRAHGTPNPAVVSARHPRVRNSVSHDHRIPQSASQVAASAMFATSCRRDPPLPCSQPRAAATRRARLAERIRDSSERTIATNLHHQPIQRSHYLARGGWVAFTREDAGVIRQAWVRSPTGLVRQIADFGAPGWIEDIGPDGSVFRTVPVIEAEGKRYRASPDGETERSAQHSAGHDSSMASSTWCSVQPCSA
jgi:hypothetical protein